MLGQRLIIEGNITYLACCFFMPKIILDAGHGGYDNGAAYNGRKEKDDHVNMQAEIGVVKSQARQ